MAETLGKRISENRKRLKLTQDQLAEQLGVTAQAVSKWENDQSCPDISMLPLLSNIFGISTDALLGHKSAETVHIGQIVDPDEEDDCNDDGISARWNFEWEPGRAGALAFAVLVLLVGGLYLLSSLLGWELSLWQIAWPSSLLVFGLFRLFRKFSFFSLGCFVLGGFYLADKLFVLEITNDRKFIWAVIILLLGISLLIDAFRKAKSPICRFSSGKRSKKHNRSHRSCNYTSDENSFSYSASFDEELREINIPRFRHGSISVCFGDFTVDLSGIEDVEAGCTLNADCSFGELTILVPSEFIIKSANSSVFASIITEGSPDPLTQKEICLDANANFAEIIIRYI